MSDDHALTVVDRDGIAVAECPRCGETVEVSGGEHDCGADLAFDGACPMCGGAYESYTEHLRECDGGE